ncbi:myeloid cell surface antigen CD33-like [Dendropsophus ebraccatus]|uniref:myeloid cell surface antigen CD33-like n=1 Tax=Dendropsophus ebraccatus TaxID=150705 RepID=UPI003831787E
MRKKCALLVSIILQVCVGQEKKFNFPSTIQALLGSCVEIPCYTSGPTANVVWHVKKAPQGQRIIYSTDVSQISSVYRNRAELLRPAPENCTLRIHDVARSDGMSYFPQERKLSSFLATFITTYVTLQVIELPPEPVLIVPGEMSVGETKTVTCMVNYTCASSPPTFTWNLNGPYATERSDLGNGKWTATSKLDYQPSDAKDGSMVIQCSVMYFGGLTRKSTSQINLLGSPADQGPSYIGLTIGIICAISLLAITFIIWRKRDSCLWGKKSECSRKLDHRFETLSKNNKRYTDLLERQTSSYYTIEPTAHSHLPRQGRNVMQSPEDASIYEDMSIGQPN